MMDDTGLLQEQFNVIRALFRQPVECRTGMEIDAESVQNLDALFGGYDALLRNFVQELEVLRFTERDRIGNPTGSEYAISDAIGQLLDLMTPFYGHGEVVFRGETFDAIVDGLQGVNETAAKVELQLEAFRGLEAARFGTGAIEEVATDAAGSLVLDTNGKVIVGNFGRRS